ncbi:MAG: hypothetical protein RIC87_11655 [Kiloniellales bacterium]
MPAARDLRWQAGAWFDSISANPPAYGAAERRAMIDAFDGAAWLSTGLARDQGTPCEAALAATDCPTLFVNGAEDVADVLSAAAYLAGRKARACKAS